VTKVYVFQQPQILKERKNFGSRSFKKFKIKIKNFKTNKELLTKTNTLAIVPLSGRSYLAGRSPKRHFFWVFICSPQKDFSNMVSKSWIYSNSKTRKNWPLLSLNADVLCYKRYRESSNSPWWTIRAVSIFE